MRIITTEKHFEMFKQEFLVWYSKFGLNEYRVEFGHAKMEEERANICYNIDDRVAIVVLSKNFDDMKGMDEEELNKRVLDSAKHEAIELLVGELSLMGKYRWVTEKDIDRATHVLVRRIQNAI